MQQWIETDMNRKQWEDVRHESVLGNGLIDARFRSFVSTDSFTSMPISIPMIMKGT